jgi:hypothetical protein
VLIEGIAYGGRVEDGYKVSSRPHAFRVNFQDGGVLTH